MAATLTRTYETFAVLFARGTRVSGFDTRDEAERYLGQSAGEVERTTFDVSFPAERAHLYRPGIAAVRESDCGCVTRYEGPLGAAVATVPCEEHTPAWQKPGFVPAPLAPAAVTEGWEALFLATYAEVSRDWPL